VRCATRSSQSNRGVVLASLKRAANDLSSHQKKLFPIDSHIGIGMSGLTADGRQLVKYMRNECINHKCASFLPQHPAAFSHAAHALAVQICV